MAFLNGTYGRENVEPASSNSSQFQQHEPTSHYYGCEDEHDSGFLDSLSVQTSLNFLKNKVFRKDFGRLDYNAEIAQRIYSNLSNANLDEPDVIKKDSFTFLVVIRNTSEYANLTRGEHVSDITKEWRHMGETWKRCISLLSKEDTPFEISKEADVLYLAENPVEILQNNAEVYEFLTVSFEKEIFAYAERALEYVETQLSEERENEQETLSYTRLEIHSLLSRKLPEHETTVKPSSDNSVLQRLPYQRVSEALQNGSMQVCDIKGFCNTIDGFLILVAEPTNQADRTNIANRIETCLQDLLKEKPKIVWVEKVSIANLTAQGCKLINTETNNFGTLGCLGSYADNSLVAITAGHFVKEEQTVQVEYNNTTENFGQCKQSHDSDDVDIAIVDINDDMKQHCIFEFRNEKGKVCKASVYQEDEIKSWPVHKIGAVTRCTPGIVYCAGAKVSDERGILISRIANDVVFAEKGDSGSIVFFYDPNDLQNKEVKLLSIVSKEIEVKAGAIPVGLSRKPTLTKSLQKGLDTIPNVKIEYKSD